MGFYSGAGIVVGGSTDCRPGGSFSDPHINGGNPVFLPSRITTETKKSPGVSLNTAQAASAQYDMKGGYWQYWEASSSGGYTYFNDGIVPEYSGTMKSVSYSQIGDSNLYELIEVTTKKETYINNSIPAAII